MKKLFTITLVVLIGVFFCVSHSNAQSPNDVSTTFFHKGDCTSLGGSSIGFFLKPSQFPGSGTNLYIAKIEVLNMNTTDNVVSLYINTTTYALATVQAQNQLLGSVEYGTGTTYVVGGQISSAAGINVLNKTGIAYPGDVGGAFNLT